jgi:hypothetical protein
LGNPLNPHYADMFAVWQRRDGAPSPWTPEKTGAATVETPTLDSADSAERH